MVQNAKSTNLNTYLDVYSFKGKNLHEWYKSKKSWPVNSNEIYEVQEEVRLIYESWINRLPDSISNPLVVLYKLKIKIEHLILMQIAIEKSSKKSILYGDKSLLNIQIYNGSAKKNDLRSFINSGLLANKVDFKTNLKQSLKTFINKIRFFEFNLNFLSKKCNEYYSIINYPHEDLVRYTKINNKKFHFIYPYLFFSKKKTTLNNKDKESFSKLVDKDLKDLMKTKDCSSIKNYIPMITDIIWELIVAADKNINKAEEYFMKNEKKGIVITSLGTIESRLIAMAAKNCDLQVIGSVHGNNTGFSLSKTNIYLEMSLCDKYILQTTGSKKLYEKFIRKNDINVKAILESQEMEKYVVPPITKSNTLDQTKMINVMVLEYPLTEHFYQYKHLFWPLQLRLALDIGNSLKDNRINSIIKLHPDRLEESKNLYSEYYMNVLEEKFEEVFEKADVLIFTHLFSTTFSLALATNKPIVVFSTYLDNLEPEVISLLSGRCIVIKSKISSEGNLQFSKKEILEKCIKAQKYDISYDIIKELMS